MNYMKSKRILLNDGVMKSSSSKKAKTLEISVRFQLVNAKFFDSKDEVNGICFIDI